MSSAVIKSTILAVALGFIVASPGMRAQGVGQGQSAEVEVEGTLEVLIEDLPNGAIVHHFLHTATEQLRLVEAPGRSDLRGLATGSRIRARGNRTQDGTLALKPGSSGGGATSSVTTLALASPNTFGEQRVAVILVNFQDDTSAPYDWSYAADVTFNQASNFYLQNSYNQTWLTGDVFGWFTIPMSTTVCDVNTLASLADQAATNAGANLNNYTRRVYAFPRNACSWWGLGTVGGNPSRAWVKGSYAVKVVAHELGHNFGDYHSNSAPCDASGCTTVEYGDDRDMMGGTAVGYFHAYQKERLGWLNYGSSPSIQTITASGTYFINSLEGAGTAAKALKILKSSTSSGNTYYYVEARSQVGFDSSYAPGVLLHTGMDTNGNSAYQVDLDPLTSGFDSLLDPAQTFSDAAAGLTITTVSADATGAWVSITYAGAPCTARTPTVTLTPGGTVMTSPSSTTNFTVSVKNNDGTSCANAGFSLATAVPTGWSWSSSQASVTVAPGSTGSASVAVTAPSTAAGTVSVTEQATRLDGSGLDGSATANLMVVTGLNVTLAITGGSNYQFKATVTAGPTPAAGVSVSFVMTGPTGARTTLSATTNSLGVATVKGRLKPRDPRGTYQVTATATSASLSGTASGSFVY
jgi:hypothetical protein